MDPLEFSVLDVGQGSANLLRWNGCRTGFLIDAGPDSMGLLDTLHSRGIDSVAWIVVSHWHRDHCGGAVELLARGFPVGRIRAGPDRAGNPWGDSLLHLAAMRRVPVDTLERGDTLVGLAPLHVRVLWPFARDSLEDNAASLVLRIEGDGEAVLFPGDIGMEEEARMLVLESDLRSTVLVLAHHGSRTSSGLAFLAAVYPEWTAVSAGTGNAYGHPHAEALEHSILVQGDSLHLLRTDLQGSLDFEWTFPGPPWPR